MEYDFLELYIQIRDGQPHEHPILGENFKEAFPDIDVNNLPLDQFAKFVRVSHPELGWFEIHEGVTYQWDGNIVKDVHHVRPMTDEERAAKIAELEARAQEERLARIDIVNKLLAEETAPEAQTILMDCLTALEEWTLESVAPLTPPFPPFPYKDGNGNWIAPAS